MGTNRGRGRAGGSGALRENTHKKQLMSNEVQMNVNAFPLNNY